MSDLDEVSFDNHSELSEGEHLSGGAGDETPSGEYDEDLDLSYDDIEETKEELKKQSQKQGVTGAESQLAGLDIGDDDEEEDDEEEEDEGYLKKFDKELRKNYLVDFHPESVSYNNIEIQTLSEVVRDPNGIIIDDFHKTIPFLTKYEKTRILGVRAKQIDSGAKPFFDASKRNLIDGYTIAQKELQLKRLPFIIRRPLPNGGSEFWKLSDLQIIN